MYTTSLCMAIAEIQCFLFIFLPNLKVTVYDTVHRLQKKQPKQNYKFLLFYFYKHLCINIQQQKRNKRKTKQNTTC